VFADRYHHRKEETYLFPVLQQRGILRDGGPLGVIENEHRIESELTAEMHRAVKGYRDVDPEARRRLSKPLGGTPITCLVTSIKKTQSCSG